MSPTEQAMSKKVQYSILLNIENKQCLHHIYYYYSNEGLLRLLETISRNEISTYIYWITISFESYLLHNFTRKNVIGAVSFYTHCSTKLINQRCKRTYNREYVDRFEKLEDRWYIFFFSFNKFLFFDKVDSSCFWYRITNNLI